MSSSDFLFWEYKDDGDDYPSDQSGWYESISAFSGPGGNGASLVWGARSFDSYLDCGLLRLYDGADAAQVRKPAQKATFAMRVENQFATSQSGILLLCPSLFSGQHSGNLSDTDFGGIFFKFGRSSTSSDFLTSSSVDIDGCLWSGGSFRNHFKTWSVPVINDHWIQMEVAAAVVQKRSDELLRIWTWARWNTGTVLSEPGSAGWSSWERGNIAQTIRSPYGPSLYGHTYACGICLMGDAGWSGGFGRVCFDRVQFSGGDFVL